MGKPVWLVANDGHLIVSLTYFLFALKWQFTQIFGRLKDQGVLNGEETLKYVILKCFGKLNGYTN